MFTVNQSLLQMAEESKIARERFLSEYSSSLIEVAGIVGHCVVSRGKILLFGNGGSAADAQHTAAELIGRLRSPSRAALPALALTTDTSNLTAVGNDFGFEYVFSRQIEALARAEDVAIAISTSGNSRNVLLAVEAAQKLGCKTIGLTGGTGGKLKDAVDVCLNVAASTHSSRIQETHIFILHALAELVETFYLGKTPGVKA